jgi:hypothetical protein
VQRCEVWRSRPSASCGSWGRGETSTRQRADVPSLLPTISGPRERKVVGESGCAGCAVTIAAMLVSDFRAISKHTGGESNRL